MWENDDPPKWPDTTLQEAVAILAESIEDKPKEVHGSDTFHRSGYARAENWRVRVGIYHTGHPAGRWMVWITQQPGRWANWLTGMAPTPQEALTAALLSGVKI